MLFRHCWFPPQRHHLKDGDIKICKIIWGKRIAHVTMDGLIDLKIRRSTIYGNVTDKIMCQQIQKRQVNG
jgi:hypothetical protein